MTKDDRIDELRKHPTFRKLVYELEQQSPEQIERLDRDFLDGALAEEQGNENDGSEEDPD